MAENATTEKTRRDSDMESFGMIFVSSPLNGDNYLVWSRAMRFALGSRMKLSFIDGRSVRPPEDSPDLTNGSKKIICPFANVRSQILVMDPRPDFVKAFAMLLNVEKELQVQIQLPEHSKTLAFKLEHKEEQNIMPSLCHIKDLADKKRKGGARGRGSFAGAVAINTAPVQHMKSADANLSDILRTELRKLLKEEGTSVERPHTPLNMMHINFAEVEEFAGNLTFVHSKSWIVDTGATRHDLRTKDKLAIGKLVGKLYIIDDASFSVDTKLLASVPLFISTAVDSACNNSLWHSRLGHSSYQAIKHITELHIKQIDSASPCHICHIFKQHRLPFPLSDTRVTSKFDLIHMNIWRPYKIPTNSGCSYFLTIADHFSRHTWTYLLKLKSQAIDCIHSFLNMIRIQFDTKVKVIRTDNGAEFLSTQCQVLFQNNGILHQRTCSYTPQQNGVAEHKHKHLLAVARALLFQASLPDRFWGDCILTATYIINRTPSHILNWSTPYKLLFNKSPTYGHMRVFGCLCYATNTNPHKTKLSPRASRCVFLGYTSGQKGYKVYDLLSHSYFVSRDLFYESSFPFASDDPTSHTHCPIPLVPHSANDTYSPATPLHIDTSDPIPTPSAEPLLSPPTSEFVPTAPRRSHRLPSKPSWMNDFYCYLDSSDSAYTFSGFSSAYTYFVASLSALQEPRSYKEAAASKEWRDAMNDEIMALERNHTWEVTTLTPGKRAIGCKWVFHLKLKEDGTVDRYKARLVAKGYTQVEGVDYVESFSPMAKAVTVRLLLAVSAARGWEIHQLDVNNAFLHGRLDEEIFMHPPEGYQVAADSVCRLTRSLYGLKQAFRQWNQEFTSQLQRFGFTQSCHDHCLFTKGSDHDFIGLLVYVDDVLVVSPSLGLIQSVKQYLHELFTIKDLGVARYFFGLQIARADEGISLNQSKYVHDILTDTGLLSAKSVTTPLPQGVK
ncbi:UNVERIFIED_CONTAM: Retrovirus-related Pol polyprotein from transposon TNT 1-94 [Sesamum latifolium]|uniref:Retrovirus-related Pol polyprotein from transposon TNT 1-94 n=1 Tax=Sesamum latifolium TaxID=2727402 RepID=A0AAW2VZP2_9LAMI